MDRGIKIAIVAACIVSLALGLLWDKVIDASRKALVSADAQASMAPDTLRYRVGDYATPLPVGARSPAVPRPAAASNSATGDAHREHPPSVNPDGSAVKGDGPSVSPRLGESDAVSKLPKSIQERVKDGKYRLQRGDSPWKLANAKGDAERFYKWGTESKDWTDANPGTRWAEDTWVVIPPYNAERAKGRE